jgi:hypothetical protein
MATRGRIGILLPDGSVLSVYSHWDNYPEFNGVKLQEHFNSYEKASELIDGGDISSLWTNRDWPNEVQEEYFTLYYSARGEFTEPRYDMSLKTYLANGEEYAYVFMNQEWVCYDLHGTPEIVKIPAPVTP